MGVAVFGRMDLFCAIYIFLVPAFSFLLLLLLQTFGIFKKEIKKNQSLLLRFAVRYGTITWFFEFYIWSNNEFGMWMWMCIAWLAY